MIKQDYTIVSFDEENSVWEIRHKGLFHECYEFEKDAMREAAILSRAFKTKLLQPRRQKSAITDDREGM